MLRFWGCKVTTSNFPEMTSTPCLRTSSVDLQISLPSGKPIHLAVEVFLKMGRIA